MATGPSAAILSMTTASKFSSMGYRKILCSDGSLFTSIL